MPAEYEGGENGLEMVIVFAIQKKLALVNYINVNAGYSFLQSFLH